MKIGPNIYGISNAVPDNCIVEQVAYNVRHGSRYPDSGAYAQWTTLYAKVDFIETPLGRYDTDI
jgi:acid phosphatase